MIDYKRKADRDYYYDYIAGAHEGRFDMINKMPEPLSMIKHIGIPDFKKHSKRKPLFLSSARYPVDYRVENGLRSPDILRDELDYNNVTGKHRNLSHGVPDLSKMTKRKFHAP